MSPVQEAPSRSGFNEVATDGLAEKLSDLYEPPAAGSGREVHSVDVDGALDSDGPQLGWYYAWGYE